MRTRYGLLLAILACGGDSTAPEPAVASLVILNAPTQPLLVGRTVQLLAVAANATGGTISGAKVTWSSDKAAVATVSSGGLVTAVGAGPVVITASSGGKTATTELDAREGASVGPSGGVLSFLGGVVRLDVAPASLSQTVDLLVRPVAAPVNDPRLVPGSVFEIAPARTFLFPAATLRLRYTAPGAALTEASLQLYGFTGSGWVLVRGSAVDLAARVVTGLVNQTGTFAVLSTPVASIRLEGAPPETAAYVGQQLTYSAAMFDINGDSLTTHPVTWASSRPEVATVAGGRVTVVGAGNTTITATADGKSVTADIIGLVRPVPSFAAAAPWMTFQGNAFHTGFLDAIVDPPAFTLRWTRSVFPGVALHPLTEGAGAAYTASHVDFGGQKAFGLDLATGAILWTRDFGAIFGAGEPAFHNDVVYLTTGGDAYLYALDSRTGIQRFRTRYDNPWFRFGAPVGISNQVFTGGGSAGGLYRFDGVTGAERWFAEVGPVDRWSPSVRDNVVYVYSEDAAASLLAFDANSGTRLFSIPDPRALRSNGYSGAPVLGARNNALVIEGHRLIAFDLGSRSIAWEVPGNFSRTAAVANGVVYASNGAGIEARRELDGDLLWRWDSPYFVTGPPVVTRNVLFICAGDVTWAIDLAAHRAVWSYPKAGALSLSASGLLLIADPTGQVHAINLR